MLSYHQSPAEGDPGGDAELVCVYELPPPEAAAHAKPEAAEVSTVRTWPFDPEPNLVCEEVYTSISPLLVRFPLAEIPDKLEPSPKKDEADIFAEADTLVGVSAPRVTVTWSEPEIGNALTEVIVTPFEPSQ